MEYIFGDLKIDNARITGVGNYELISEKETSISVSQNNLVVYRLDILK